MLVSLGEVVVVAKDKDRLHFSVHALETCDELHHTKCTMYYLLLCNYIYS